MILRQIFLQLRVILLLLLLAAVACYWIMRGVYRWVRFPHRRRLTYAAPAAYAMAVLGVASFRSHVRCYDQLSVFIPRLPINLTGIGLGPKPPSAIPFDHALQNSLQQIDPQWQKAFAAPRPLDTSAHLDRSDPPNVIVLVIDSLRRDMFTPKYMPQFYARAQKGLILAEHRPGVNCTKMGLFTICYGRYALFRTRMLDAGIKPQLPAVFKQSGYHTTYVEGDDFRHFRRMWDYLGPGNGFDDTLMRLHGNHWDAADKDVLKTIRRILQNRRQPQFIVSLLLSVHFPYFYPPGYEKFYPVEDPRKTPHQHGSPARSRALF